ncbi:DUF938 domain-containing protein [Oceanicola sp. 22II-s10i]|uniref:DUF938 domain-containing protein n=1 Tax=Oceanicola sp. 22II-s10i TaxID=1317116 RepID=UPI000B5230BD|nr:DUF938 domain-containing protein [Oceanicola sp. 22II-s10i]
MTTEDTGNQPTSAHVARYTPDRHADYGDARLSSPVFPRNSPPLIAALTPWLGGRTGKVLEIGCGTGQHGAAFELAWPGIAWQASDPYPEHCASAESWRLALKLPSRDTLALDAAADWGPEVTAAGPFTAVFTANVIHIAPPAVLAGILRGAPQVLGPCGLLIFYGPFMENGRHTGEGNARFDAGLRADNPDWGLRDIADLREGAAAEGLEMAAVLAMPANNRVLIFRKP